MPFKKDSPHKHVNYDDLLTPIFFILKYICNQKVSGSIAFHSMDKNTMEVNGTQNYLVTNVLQTKRPGSVFYWIYVILKE